VKNYIRNTPLFFKSCKNKLIVKKFTLISVLVILFTSAFSQLTRQPISNYTPAEYGQQYSSYTHAIAEDDNGIIYIGTAFGILQFDGTSWRFIPVKSGVHITSLAVYNNTVFVGSQGEFGVLKANDLGKLEYYSLSNQLPIDESGFSRIWKTIVWKQQIVFQAEEKLFIYFNDSITIVNPQTSFHLAFVVDEKLYVRERGVGLLEFDGIKFSLAPNGHVFSDLGIFVILPFQEDSKLIVTMEKGLWIWDKGNFTRIKRDIAYNTKLINAEVIGGIKLSDGNYALKTAKNGILILDKLLNIIIEYSENSGMLSSDIKDIIEDEYGNLWAATQRGVSRLLYTCPFSYFNQSSGLYGTVQAIGKMGEDLLVGTSVGLFINHPIGMKAFDEVSETKGSGGVWAIERSPKGLWIGTENGLWLYDGSNVININQRYTNSLKYVPERDWIISAGIRGVQIIESKTQTLLQNIDEIKGDTYGIAYKIHDSIKMCEIWLGTKNSGVFQILVDPTLKFNINFYMGSDDGLPPDWICSHNADDNVVFATSDGMLRFVYPEEIYTLLNDSTLSVDDLRGYFDFVDFPKSSYDKSITAFYFDEVESYAALDYHVYSISMRDSIPSNYDYITLQLGRINTIEKQGNELFVGGDIGLAIVNQQKLIKSYYAKPYLLLRSINIGYDSTAWYGDVPLNEKQFVIPFSMNALNISISSTYHDNGIGAQYSWMLKGVDKGYTRWTNQGNIQLSNLREGDYELLMVAKNIHDELGNEISLSFKILPPWYRSLWAYALYTLSSIILVFFIIQYNIRRLKVQNRRLEEIVRQRTKEVVEQKEHIENILEDIRSSINYAQRIQQALLPSHDLINEYLPNHFIIFRPRDVVSGDFYWAAKVGQWIIVTVVDCTGHGVPGAFMSMLGISFLHEIVRKEEVVNAAKVLNELRKAVIEALKQTGKQNEQKDGMDMSLIAINLETRKCLWAGANNPLYIVRKNAKGFENEQLQQDLKHRFFTFKESSLHEIRADKMPVAIHTIMDEYTNHEISLMNGDRLYLFTDGFADQFGGTDYRKFMAKSFKELIANTSILPIVEQGKAMEKTLIDWMNQGGNDVEQIDDVTVMGIEI